VLNSKLNEYSLLSNGNQNMSEKDIEIGKMKVEIEHMQGILQKNHSSKHLER